MTGGQSIASVRGRNGQSKGRQAETHSDPDDEGIRSAKEAGRHAAFGTKLGPGCYSSPRTPETFSLMSKHDIAIRSKQKNSKTREKYALGVFCQFTKAVPMFGDSRFATAGRARKLVIRPASAKIRVVPKCHVREPVHDVEGQLPVIDARHIHPNRLLGSRSSPLSWAESCAASPRTTTRP